ncbi:MAG: hypothetical protein GTO71_03380 [Woeseiaceae bacterium]|nr:hypothetical protein [Woeseiaceae bacterium]NIP20152.1 hypothetical protein [Woeseiaceae bacterium]NIS88948.1 hypothetical protein [Woeseiaceae bacterium]
MNNDHSRHISQFSIADAARARVATYLYAVYATDDGLLGNLDRWTQRRITEENMAKLALVFDSDDPAEACYGDLIRELDAEAETGVYLARQGSPARHLKRVVDEPGVSGELYNEIDVIAPKLFADEVAHSTEDLDLVWITIEACHDRAHVDATVSEIIMTHLLDDADAARDMSNAIRALQYAFHEDVIRRRCDLPRLMDDRDERDLVIMVTELARRSGSYEARSDQIQRQVESSL